MYDSHPKTSPLPSWRETFPLGLRVGPLLLRAFNFGRPKESLEGTQSTQPKQNHKATHPITRAHIPNRIHHHGGTPRPCHAPSCSAASAHTGWRLRTRHTQSASRASSPRALPEVTPTLAAASDPALTTSSDAGNSPRGAREPSGHRKRTHRLMGNKRRQVLGGREPGHPKSSPRATSPRPARKKTCARRLLGNVVHGGQILRSWDPGPLECSQHATRLRLAEALFPKSTRTSSFCCSE